MTWIFRKLYLVWKRFLENCNWFRIFGKIFLKIVFSSLFTFWVKKEFWSKKIFGKEFLYGQNKGKVFIKPTWFRRSNRAQRGLLKIFFWVFFSWSNTVFCSILFKKRKYVVFNVRNWEKKEVFSFEKFVSFQREKT